MPRGPAEDPIRQELRAILAVLQDLMILECARIGMKREDLREIVGVDNMRISRIMKHVRRLARAQRDDDAT